MTTKHTKGEWREFPAHEQNSVMKKDNNYRTIEAGDGFLNDDNAGFSITGFISENDTKLIASAPKLLQRVEDLEQAILRFKTHLEELGGNYTQDELWKMINTATVDRPYYPPVSYHDDWSGKEVTNVKD